MITVMGATGQTGGAIARRLLDAGKQVRALGRSETKLDELRRALPGWEIGPVSAGDPPPEDGETYEDNARIKALWGRQHAPAPIRTPDGCSVGRSDRGPGHVRRGRKT